MKVRLIPVIKIIVIILVIVFLIAFYHILYVSNITGSINAISASDFEVDFEEKTGETLHGTGVTYIDGNGNIRVDMRKRTANDSYIEKYKNMDIEGFEDKGGSIQTYKEAISILPSVIDKNSLGNIFGTQVKKASYGYDIYETVEYDDGEKIICKYMLYLDKNTGMPSEIQGEHFSGTTTNNKSSWEKHYTTKVYNIRIKN